MIYRSQYEILQTKHEDLIKNKEKYSHDEYLQKIRELKSELLAFQRKLVEL